MAVPSALRLAHHYEGYLAFRVFLFRTAVYATTAFVPLLVLVALGFYMACRREGDAG